MKRDKKYDAPERQGCTRALYVRCSITNGWLKVFCRTRFCSGRHPGNVTRHSKRSKTMEIIIFHVGMPFYRQFAYGIRPDGRFRSVPCSPHRSSTLPADLLCTRVASCRLKTMEIIISPVEMPFSRRFISGHPIPSWTFPFFRIVSTRHRRRRPASSIHRSLMVSRDRLFFQYCKRSRSTWPLIFWLHHDV